MGRRVLLERVLGPPVIRLALATVAHALATASGPAVSHDR
jgi:hypothetical protein